jgi:uncharacterized membrane protein YqiK
VSESLIFLLVPLALIIVLAISMGLVLRGAYRKVPAGKALLIHAAQGKTRVSFTGAVVLPVVHSAELVDVTVKTLLVERMGRTSLACADGIRADLRMTFLLRVNPTAEDVQRVAQALGAERAGDEKVLEELLSAKFSEAMKTVAFQLQVDELLTQTNVFRDHVLREIGQDLNGLILEDAVVNELVQTPVKHYDPDNVLDARGLEAIARRTKEHHDAIRKLLGEDERAGVSWPASEPLES